MKLSTLIFISFISSSPINRITTEALDSGTQAVKAGAGVLSKELTGGAGTASKEIVESAGRASKGIVEGSSSIAKIGRVAQQDIIIVREEARSLVYGKQLALGDLVRVYENPKIPLSHLDRWGYVVPEGVPIETAQTGLREIKKNIIKNQAKLLDEKVYSSSAELMTVSKEIADDFQRAYEYGRSLVGKITPQDSSFSVLKDIQQLNIDDAITQRHLF